MSQRNVSQCIQVSTSLMPVTIAMGVLGGVVFIVCVSGALCWYIKSSRKRTQLPRQQQVPGISPSSSHMMGLPPAYSNSVFAHGMEASGGAEVNKTAPPDHDNSGDDDDRSDDFHRF